MRSVNLALFIHLTWNTQSNSVKLGLSSTDGEGWFVAPTGTTVLADQHWSVLSSSLRSLSCGKQSSAERNDDGGNCSQCWQRPMKNTPFITALDITGGAPAELNDHSCLLVKMARNFRPYFEIIDHCNLTILQEPGQEDPLLHGCHGTLLKMLMNNVAGASLRDQ